MEDTSDDSDRQSLTKVVDEARHVDVPDRAQVPRAEHFSTRSPQLAKACMPLLLLLLASLLGGIALLTHCPETVCVSGNNHANVAQQAVDAKLFELLNLDNVGEGVPIDHGEGQPSLRAQEPAAPEEEAALYARTRAGSEAVAWGTADGVMPLTVALDQSTTTKTTSTVSVTSVTQSTSPGTTTTTTARAHAFTVHKGDTGTPGCGPRTLNLSAQRCRHYAAGLVEKRPSSCGYIRGCEGEDERSHLARCAEWPTGCSLDEVDGCVVFKGGGPSIASPRVTPICLAVTSLTILGASGPTARSINGEYDPTGTLYNGRPLLGRRDGTPGWFRFTKKGSWMVSNTQHKDANDNTGVLVSVGLDRFDPTKVGTWLVWGANRTWEHQDVMVAATTSVHHESMSDTSGRTVKKPKVVAVRSITKAAHKVQAVGAKATSMLGSLFVKPWKGIIHEIQTRGRQAAFAGGRWMKKRSSNHKPATIRVFQGSAERHRKQDSSKRGARIVTMARFLLNSFLNGRYTERLGMNHTVNGRETYWSDLGYVLFYCAGYKKWMIAHNGNFKALRKGHCYFWAQALDDADILNQTAHDQGWLEWNKATKKLLLRLKAGPDYISNDTALQSRVDYYDAWRAHWLSCGKRTYNRGVRNQGNACNNCWAMAAAQAIEWRLCMATNGTFMGDNAHISEGYITSCASAAFQGANGCQGGDMVTALRWVGVHGVPTGGDGNNKDTCVPNFQNGVMAKDAPPPTGPGGTLVPPTCPHDCTNHRYPRTLEQDLFHLRGLSESWRTTAFESATKAIATSGPILLNFAVYDDFLTYQKGTVYKRKPTSKLLYKHVVIAFGYSWDPPLLNCINSWGNNWGNDGRFKLHPGEVLNYVIPGEVTTTYPNGLPLPLPAHGHGAFNVWTSGFHSQTLNNQWTPSSNRTKWIANKATFWDDQGNHVLYYCNYKKRWAITGGSNLNQLRHGKCFWLALAGDDCDYLLDFDCNWGEWDSLKKELVVRRGAGVSGINY